MDDQNKSQPNLLHRIYRSPDATNKRQSQPQGLQKNPAGNYSETKQGSTLLVANVGAKKKSQAQPEARPKKTFNLGGYNLGEIKEHQEGAVFFHEKTDKTMISPTLEKIRQKNIPVGVNPNALLPAGDQKKKEELSASQKKNIILNFRGGAKPEKDKNGQSQDEYLSPFDFIALLRTDPDMADEFCYLNKRENSYDWMIVDFEKRNTKEYMTISSRGITHFLDDEATFLTIEEWEREVSMYHRLKSIPFFRDYKIWKNYTVWKHLFRKNMMRDRSQLLNQESFFLDRHLNTALLRIRKICIDDIATIDIFKTSFDDPRTLEEFIKEQEEFKSKKLSHLEGMEAAIRDTIEQRCNMSMQAFKEENRIQNRNEANEGDEPPPLLVGDETNKEMPYTQEATIRTHQRKLRKFIKLVDYLVLEAKMRMITYSTENLFQALQLYNKAGKEKVQKTVERTAKAGQPMLIIEAWFSGTEVTYHPSARKLTRLFEEIVNKGINLICSRHKQFLHESEFNVYAKSGDFNEDPTEELINMHVLIKNHKEQNDMMDCVRQELDVSFNYVSDKASNLNSRLEIYQDHQRLDVEAVAQKEIEEIRQALNRYDNEHRELQKPKEKSDIGMYRLDKKRLLDTIKDCAKKSKDKLEARLPQLNYERARGLVERVERLNDKLANPPTNVDAFVVFVRDLNETISQQDEIALRVNEINDMTVLVEERKIKVKEDFKSEPMNAVRQAKKLEQGVKRAEESQNANINKFRAELAKDISAIGPKVEDIRNQLGDTRLSEMASDIDTMVEFLVEVEKKASELKENGHKYNVYQDELQMEVTPFISIEDVWKEFQTNKRLWVSKKEWKDSLSRWRNTQFLQLNIEEMALIVEKISKAAMLCAKELELNEVAKNFRAEVEEFKVVIDVIVSLRGEALKESHWEEIKVLIDRPNVPESLFINREDPALTFQTIVDLNLDEYRAKLQDIAVRAIKETELEKMLANVMGFWNVAFLTITPYKDKMDFYILGNNEELITRLDDSLETISSILSSRYVEGIRGRVEKEKEDLRYFQELLDAWMICQKNWMYLEPIFSSPDIQKQLSSEYKRFHNVEIQWKNTMKNALLKRSAGHWAHNEKNQLASFKKDNESLEKVQKALEDYLETKRQEFPRFFFLSNDELLEILSQAKEPQRIQPHLRKCFENINKLEFESNIVAAMISAEGERVELKNLKAQGPVETWLRDLEKNMQETLKVKMEKAIEALNRDDAPPKKEWVKQHHSQLILAVDSIEWTRVTEEFLHSENAIDDMEKWYESVVAQLQDLTELIRGELTSNERRTIVALVTQDVHYRDIVEQLKNDQVDNANDFKWQQQLRFYFKNKVAEARQVNSTLPYGYEYLGAPTRLVITPLTDRCWMTITGALHIQLGAAPAGPAGTGKTESVKDLAKALGRLCVVFNCSEQITVRMMEKLFMGLCATDSWACLDEFNRINIEVLSVIAQQVRLIKDALHVLHGKNVDEHEVYFGSKRVALRPNMGIFITMNPGYAGRTELPDNLKVLFRPVSMMVPDYTLIAEIMLFAEGFSDAKDLSRKMTKLYKLASEQLSQQDHYDFGMRAVKSVLVMAGALKRAEPKLSEDIVLIRAMRDSNVPKFLSHDLPLFNAIISDLFPDVEIPNTENAELINQIKEEIEKQNLPIVDTFVEKVVQYHETLRVRFGVMLVGPSMAGKSTVYKTLKDAYTSLRKKDSPNQDFQVVEAEILNPKAISMGELYGDFDNFTLEWTDGLAAKMMREYASKETPEKKWVMFDGPVDALWIENMNTVLDDNMTLCLSNGERVKLKWQMKMLFEVQDLAVASPATVSRCGMVYLDNFVVGSENVIKNYVDNILTPLLPPEGLELISKSFLLHFTKTVGHIRKHFTEPIATVDNNLALSIVRIIEILLKKGEFKPANMNPESLKKGLDKIFLFSFVWGISSAMNPIFISKFENFLGTIFQPNDLPRGSIYDSFLSYENKPEGEFKEWSSITPEFVFSKEKTYFELIVPTKDTVRYSWFVENSAENLYSVFFTGITGVGKTIIVEQALERMRAKGSIETLSITFSAKTSSLQAQLTIEGKLFPSRKDAKITLKPPAGKKLVVFIDDINMPAKEEYGAQPPIELLRLFQDKKGFFDRTQHFWKEVKDTILIAASAPPGGGRSDLTPRFTRHFHMMCLPPTQEESLSLIFGSILTGFLKTYVFRGEIVSMVDSVVGATLDIYNKISNELLPTPAKSHYTFNLRDVSKVFQGILLTRPICVQNTDTMARLWIHETCRVFYDRLVNDEDRTWFKNNVVTMLVLYFKVEWTAKEVFEENPVIFADFMKKGVEMNQRTYEEVKDYNRLVKVITEYMDEETNMKLVLFKDAVEHLCRVARILRLLRGHAMLVGLGGSGKKAITKLASVLAGAGDPIMIEPRKGYKEDTFRQDLFEKMMYKAGVENKTLTFLFPDTHILKESFLEDINNLLNSGEVPNLFKKDDLEKLKSTMADVIKEEGVQKDPYGYFVERVRSNLHIVLAMSPVGDKLRNRLRMFPSLVNCCTIDWINPWPEDALLSVAKMSLETLEFEGATPQLKESLAQMCMFSHITIEQEADRFYRMLKRKVYTTPKGYIDLIESYLLLLKEKYNELNSYKNKLAGGLTKLAETNEIVKSLEENLTKLKPILKEKSIEQEALIQKIKIDRVDADKVKEVVEAEEKIVNDKAQKIKSMKDEADKILSEAVPILNGAREALSLLNRQELAEVKGNQHALIKFMWSCCAILLYNKEDDDTVRKMLADASLITKMQNMDYDHVPEDIQRKVKKKLASNPEFTPEIVGSKQGSAKSIAKWVRAVSEYTEIAKEVESKQKYVNETSGQLNAAMSQLKSKQDELAVVMKKVTDLETQLHDSIKEKDRLEHEKQLTEERLDRAGKLTTGLADEQIRWKEKVEELKEDVRKLIGDVFLSAASVVYYGPFTGSFRAEIVEKWFNKCKELEIPCSDDYTLTKTLGNPVQIRDWNIAGLPSDSVSVNNGILVFKTNSWPFMIDPQLQANKWIKSLEARSGRQLQIIKSSDNIAKMTETCLRMGNPLLIEDMQETLDPSLEPLLTKQFNISNNRMMVKIDSSEVEYDPKFFSLYFTTKIANPHFLPEIFIRVSVINFTVTELGLEEQLLADVVSKEMPEKEQLKNELIMSISKNKQSLVESENRILELLSKSQGLVLDDKELVEKLQESKIKSNEVKKNLAESEETQKNIDEARSKCKPVATRGSILYFVIADLALIDPMYQFSLSYFNRLFNTVIDTSPKSDDLDERINILMTAITETIYLNVCRGLFNTHKQLFSFLVSSAINRKAGDITGEEWNVFLKGIPLVKSNIPITKLPPKTKFNEKSWELFCQTQNAIPCYSEVVKSILENPAVWEGWVYSQEPILTDLPLGFEQTLTVFQKLLLIKLLRTEKSLISMNLYVLKTLGQKFFSNVPATMEEVYQDTDPKIPLIFILSPGADPLQNLQRFARDKQMFEKLHTISLGQGQEGPAEDGIKEGRKDGRWILLQNCHLAKSFMPKLERILETFEDPQQASETNPNFRLFLSSMPCDYFPVSVLQNGVKLTNEPPKGLKANMTRTYNEFSQAKLDECSKPEIWRKLLFSFSLFHAIIQERRKFGPLGWNIRYEFNDSDLETSMTMLYNMLEGQQEVPWDAIKFMTGQINYGGRVTDDNDRKCLLAILEMYCGEHVLSDDYTYSRSGIYKSPNDGDLSSYKKVISNFPDLEDPEVFGMHANANITFEMTESMIAITTILSIQPRDVSGAEGKSPDEIVDSLATELENRIPPLIKKEQEDKPHKGPQPTYIDSLQVCLTQEIERFNRKLNVMRRTLAELKKAIKGEVVMSVELDKMHQNLLNNQVPLLWQKVSYPSLKNLASWFDDLIKRVEFFTAWLNKGKPRGYWLSAFFFPQGFLTSVLQNYARKYKTPIDVLGFAFEFLDFVEIEKVHAQPEDGCYIYGLFVEGCRFDFKHGRLEDSRPGEMYTEAPVIYFNPTENYVPDTSDYSMPVYKTTVRAGTLSTTGHSTNFIIYVDVPTKQRPETWTLNGAAFVCAINT